MNKAKLSYFVNILTFLVFLKTAVTGLIIYFFIPEGVRRGGYQEFLGFTKHTWVSTHYIAGFILSALVLTHIFLNRKMMVAMTKSFFKKDSQNSNPQN